MALAAMSADRKTLLVTGEESAAQVKLRADRLGGARLDCRVRSKPIEDPFSKVKPRAIL
jgi:predicted ATP-dependent serine protease